MNRLADLRRHTVAAVLEDRWMPLSFANGTLVRRGLTVVDVGLAGCGRRRAAPAAVRPTESARPAGPAQPTRRVRGAAADSRSAGALPGRPAPPGVAVGVDGAAARHRRRRGRRPRPPWWRCAASHPSDYDLPRLQGAFSELYGERTTCLVVSDAGDYETLVSSWLDQVDDDNVIPARGRVAARRRPAADHPRQSVGQPGAGPLRADRASTAPRSRRCRRLLPHRHIEFISDWADDEQHTQLRRPGPARRRVRRPPVQRKAAASRSADRAAVGVPADGRHAGRQRHLPGRLLGAGVRAVPRATTWLFNQLGTAGLDDADQPGAAGGRRPGRAAAHWSRPSCCWPRCRCRRSSGPVSGSCGWSSRPLFGYLARDGDCRSPCSVCWPGVSSSARSSASH